MTLYLRQIWKDERLSYTSFNRRLAIQTASHFQISVPQINVSNGARRSASPTSKATFLNRAHTVVLWLMG